MMRVNKHMKKILPILFLGIVISISAVAITKINEHRIKEKVINNGNRNGYNISFTDNKHFWLEKDDAEFFYNISTSGIEFEKCIFRAEEKDVEVKSGQVEIYIEKKNDRLQVWYHDSRLVIRDNKEEQHYDTGGFICNKNFDENSVEGDAIIDGEQKAMDAYWGIMRITNTDNLKSHYDQALAICDELK